MLYVHNPQQMDRLRTKPVSSQNRMSEVRCVNLFRLMTKVHPDCLPDLVATVSKSISCEWLAGRLAG